MRKRNVLLSAAIAVAALGTQGGCKTEQYVRESVKSPGKPETVAAAEGESTPEALTAAGSAAGFSGTVDEKNPALKTEKSDSRTLDTVPALPATGKQLSDFIPHGWTLIDSITLDFNEDGLMDYVGVLEHQPDSEYETCKLPFCPRIMFAIASDAAGQYKLDFQDMNLIRTRDEGGVFGDPYEPLTAEKKSFTTHTFGGSAWKWSEAYTYSYKKGDWYLTAAENTYGYGGYITDHSIDDYEKRIGIRYKRSEEFEDMEKNMVHDWDSVDYDLTYEVPLDPPITLYQASMRWWLSPNREEEWPVDSVKFAEGLDKKDTPVIRPEAGQDFKYQDENHLLYSYMDANAVKGYIALYSRKDKTLSVIAETDSAIDDITMYKGTVYYTAEIMGPVTYKDYEGTIRQADKVIGMKLNCISADGTDPREIFSYRLPLAEDEVLETGPPYISLITEINGNEIVTEVYIGDQPHPFYRMNLDGSGVEKIGTVPMQ